MEDQQKQLIAKLKEAQNVLVTVSKNPSVDQLSAAIGLTLALNKLDKHATAVYSGQTPSTIEFLKPEDTLEKNTDSLRDFIIALDKSKADKLRYKVEDDVVRIFITPYRTSISDQDLEFSQGDFNVDVVVALGVKEQADLDAAIQAHGRILHDATVSSIAIEGQPELGTLNVVDTNASSLCEVVTKLVSELDKGILDGQIATALLTGVVAMTDRFSNDKTTPDTMSLSASLMAAGANQQLIATELEAESPANPAASVESPSADTPQKDPGTLEISHDEQLPPAELPPVPPASDRTQAEEASAPEEASQPPLAPQIHVDENGQLITEEDNAFPKIQNVHSQSNGMMPQPSQDEQTVRERMVEPPSLGGELTANTSEEGLGGPPDEATRPSSQTPILSHNEHVLGQPTEPMQAPQQPASAPPEPVFPSQQDDGGGANPTVISPDVPGLPGETEPAPQSLPPLSEPSYAPPAPSASSVVPSYGPADDEQVASDVIDTSKQTLSDIEHVVDSPHLEMTGDSDSPATAPADVDAARSAVEAAIAAMPSPTNPDPIAALNAQPLGPELHQGAAQPYQPAPGFEQTPTNTGFSEPTPGNTPADMTLDMPLPGSSTAPSPPSPSTFPGVLPQNSQDTTLSPPPPVPPPPIFPTA